jgi:arylsulfatase A-like enzyme
MFMDVYTAVPRPGKARFRTISGRGIRVVAMLFLARIDAMRHSPKIPGALALLAFGSCFYLAGCGAGPGGPGEKPNVLILLADDLGYGELGCQGNPEIPTPNIDSIAAGGVRFTDGYASAPFSGPSRAGLMTGRYQTRFGHEFNAASRPGLSMKERTFADRLKALGYATCAVGKWHLGDDPGWYPMKRGFDTFYGTPASSPYSAPPMFIDSRKAPGPKSVEDASFYTTAAYGAFAADWIREQKGPWFLYVPFNAPHSPLQATDDLLARVPPGIPHGDRRRFAAVLIGLDDAVGKILQAVRDAGQERKTLVVFLSATGGPTEETSSQNGQLRGFKETLWEGGIRVPFLMRWKGVLPEGKTYGHPVIHLDLLPTALAAAGAEPDPAWKLDGVNLLPFLTGKNQNPPHPALCWRSGEDGAIRHGNQKLVLGRLPEGGKGGGDATLFDLASDPGELEDLAAQQPAKAAELRALWDAWNAEQIPPSSAKETPRKRLGAKPEKPEKPEGDARGPAAAEPGAKKRPPKAKGPRARDRAPGGGAGKAPEAPGS